MIWELSKENRKQNQKTATFVRWVSFIPPLSTPTLPLPSLPFPFLLFLSLFSFTLHNSPWVISVSQSPVTDHPCLTYLLHELSPSSYLKSIEQYLNGRRQNVAEFLKFENTFIDNLPFLFLTSDMITVVGDATKNDTYSQSQ